MNDKLLELLNNHIDELSQSLNLSSTHAYEKAIWYLKLNGIINLLFYVFIPIYIFIWFFVSNKIVKNSADSNDEDIYYWFFLALVGMGLFVIIFGITQEVFLNITKIWMPEYYLIEQIINKTGI